MTLHSKFLLFATTAIVSHVSSAGFCPTALAQDAPTVTKRISLSVDRAECVGRITDSPMFHSLTLSSGDNASKEELRDILSGKSKFGSDSETAGSVRYCLNGLANLVTRLELVDLKGLAKEIVKSRNGRVVVANSLYPYARLPYRYDIDASLRIHFLHQDVQLHTDEDLLESPSCTFKGTSVFVTLRNLQDLYFVSPDGRRGQPLFGTSAFLNGLFQSATAPWRRSDPTQTKGLWLTCDQLNDGRAYDAALSELRRELIKQFEDAESSIPATIGANGATPVEAKTLGIKGQ